MGTWLPVAEEATPQQSLWVAGRFTGYDGGQTTLAFNVFGYMMGSNDHVVLIRFTPLAENRTDVEFFWLVDPNAEEGRDYSIDELTRVWDVTTMEDKRITEDNQAGVTSRRYRPGRYLRLVTVKDWYLRRMGK